MDDCAHWVALLERYPQVIEEQGSERLIESDRWYREAFPGLLSSREEPHITLEELQRVASWKMLRGVWRERNRKLIAGNDAAQVVELSRKAFAAVPDPARPITILSALAGVGPATASAVMAAYAPRVYPFFDDLVAAQIPGLGPVTFTGKYYAAYSQALRKRAAHLQAECGREWTAHEVSQALWAASGGKAAQG